MNSDEMWLLQLWSGSIGAFVAAVIGGLVAWQVVQLTGKQQKRHAAEARAIAALADVIAVAETMATNWTDESYDTDELFLKFRAALIRLRLAGSNTEQLWLKLEKWPEKLAELSEKAKASGALTRLATAMTMVQLVKDLNNALVLWTKKDKKSQKQSILQLQLATNSLNKALEKQSK